MRAGALVRIIGVLMLAACSSSGRTEPSEGGGADAVGGSSANGGAPASGGARAGGAPMTGGSPSHGGSSADATGPSCPDGGTQVIVKEEFPIPSAECVNFVEKHCPGQLDDCVHHWCGDYLACACQCADRDTYCYGACDFPIDCNTCMTQLQECGIGLSGSPCFPPME